MTSPTPITTRTADEALELARRQQFVRRLVGGIIGGSLHALIEQPLVNPIEACITQTQINGHNVLHNFKDLLRRRALYRSLPAALLGAVPKAIVHYSILSAYIEMFAPDSDMSKATARTAMLIGTAVGASEVWITSPINFVKFRMQRPEWGYTSTADAIATIARVEGIAAFWKGTSFVFLRNTSCNGVMVGGYKFTHLYMEGEDRFQMVPSSLKHFLSGSVGGWLGSLVSYPFEMMRAAKQHNISFREHIWAKGPKRLLAGWAPGAVRLTFTSSIMGVIIPNIRPLSDQLVGLCTSR